MMHLPPRADDPVVDQAITWHLRLRDADEAAWDGFMLWLEQSPMHNIAYEEVAAADASADAWAASMPTFPHAANDEGPRERGFVGRRSFVAATALAASLLVGVLSWPLLRPDSSPFTVGTRPGEQRTVRLDDRTRVALNGGTRVTLDRNDSRFARLEGGEATFEVVHDAAKPFRLEVGDATLVDIGTAFNVVREGRSVRVQVSEGAVRYRSGTTAVELAAGQALEDAGDGMLVRRSVDRAQVGGWRRGALSYRDAPLARVAADLSRSLGTGVKLRGMPLDTRFTGVIQVEHDDGKMKRQLDALLGVRASRIATGWLLTPDDRAHR